MQLSHQEATQERHVICTDPLGYTYCPDCAPANAEPQVVASTDYPYHCDHCEKSLPATVEVTGTATIEHPKARIF